MSAARLLGEAATAGVELWRDGERVRWRGTPPAGLTLPTTTLAALGFPAFSQPNPTITFIVADTAFGDNSGQFTLTQAAAPMAVAPVPTLAQWSLAALALLVGLGGVARARRR